MIMYTLNSGIVLLVSALMMKLVNYTSSIYFERKERRSNNKILVNVMIFELYICKQSRKSLDFLSEPCRPMG